METVLVMPILLLLIFGILQFAHIWMARQMVAYAAFCATRAIMVTRSVETSDMTFEDPGETGVVEDGVDEQWFFAQKAAEVALSWINLADGGRQDEVSVPGWGAVVGSGSSTGGQRVTVAILSRGYDAGGDNPPCAAVQVRFLFPLMIPGMAVNKIIATAVQSGSVVAPSGDFYADLNKAAGSPTLIDGWPYIALEETCVLPMPYSTRNFPLRAVQSRDAGEFDYTRIDIRREVKR